MTNKAVRILAAVALVLFSIQHFSNNKADVDLWGNVGFVKTMPWSPEFHRTNTFSFTDPDHTWINHEWLSEIILNKTYLLTGNTGLIAFKVILGLIAIGLLTIPVRKGATSGLLQFFFLMLIISTMGYGFSIRPHLFTYVMLILFLMILKYHDRDKPHALLAMPLLGLAWANLHGAFFIGIVLMIFFTGAEVIRNLTTGRFKEESRHMSKLLGVLVMLLAASLVTPYGTALWKFIAASAVTARPYLSEWAPFNARVDFTDHTDFIALAILSAAALAFSKRRRDPTWICLLALSFLGAMVLRRNIPIFAIVTCFTVPEHMQDVAGETLAKIGEKTPKPVQAALLCLFIPLSACYVFAFNKHNPFQIEVPRDRFPTGVTSFIKTNNLKGNMLTFFDWSEFCIWKLYPDCKMFLDGRFTDAYSTTTVTNYLTILYSGADWQNILMKYPVDMLLLHKDNSTYNMLREYNDRPYWTRTPGVDSWKLVCEDQISGLFLKNNVHSNFIDSMQNMLPVIIKEKQDAIFP